MFTRKVDDRRPLLTQWCVCAIFFSSATMAFGQFGGGSGGTGVGTPDRVLFPKGLPSMDNMLQAALEHHPDVLAARSKLRAAEAEQRQAELKALKDVIDLRDRWEKAKNLAAAVEKLNPADLRSALMNQTAVEWELALLLGSSGESLAGLKVVSEPGKMGSPATATAPAAIPIVIKSVVPTKEQATPIREKLQKKIEVQFTEMPLKEVARYFSEESGLRFVLDEQALEDSGFPADLPITCELGEIELVSAIQALEDLKEPLHFVVRDYGICVTTKSRQSWTTVSVWDFVKLNEQELQDKLQQQRQEFESNNAARGGGGFF